MIKTTYALDVDSVKALDALARRWKVSKSEALRRAIHVASAVPPAGADEALATLDRLQRGLRLTPERATAWIRGVRRERRASSGRRLSSPR